MKDIKEFVDILIRDITSNYYAGSNVPVICESFKIPKTRGVSQATQLEEYLSRPKKEVLADLGRIHPKYIEILKYLTYMEESSTSTEELVRRFSLTLDKQRHVPKYLLLLESTRRYGYYYYRESNPLVSKDGCALPESLQDYLFYLFGDYETQPEVCTEALEPTYVYPDADELADFVKEFFSNHSIVNTNIPQLNPTNEVLKTFSSEIKLPASPYWKPYKVSAEALALSFAIMSNIRKKGYDYRSLLEDWSKSRMENVEADVMFKHLKIQRSSQSFYKQGYLEVYPYLRILLLSLLKDLPDPGAWYRIEELERVYSLSGFDYTVYSAYAVLGDEASLDIVSFRDREGVVRKREDFPNFYEYENELESNYDLFLDDCCMKGLFYMLALYGIVDLCEKEDGTKCINSKNKEVPYHPFAGAYAMRLTPYGQWLLGYIDKPEKKVKEYEVIADSDLLVVTFSGNNLKAHALLEKLGVQVGPFRYKVTSESFLSGITTKKAFDKRVADFRSLVGENLPDNWENFLSYLEGAFNRKVHIQPAMIFRVENPSDIAPYLNDRTFRSIFYRMEGGALVAVDEKIQKAYEFFRLHGISFVFTKS